MRRVGSRVPGRVVRFLLTLVVLCPTGTACGKWPWERPEAPPETPHPAVVRVLAEESDGMAQGSGTLVDVRDQFGLVVTNWHVVRGASGAVNVIFPDGFRSAARVLHVDRDWDLAALLIWRPRVAPVPLAVDAPRPGDPLTIAGYGSGIYRTAPGKCTQYLAPGTDRPFEMVEVSTSARQGDSGGPIFNTRGELAGVLFGSDGGSTSGSYAGRVREFLQASWSSSEPTEAPGDAGRSEPPAWRRPATATTSGSGHTRQACRTAGLVAVASHRNCATDSIPNAHRFRRARIRARNSHRFFVRGLVGGLCGQEHLSTDQDGAGHHRPGGGLPAAHQVHAAEVVRRPVSRRADVVGQDSKTRTA